MTEEGDANTIATIMCFPVGTRALLPDAAQVRTCTQCPRQVWCAPSSIAMIDRGEAKPLCMVCVVDTMDPAEVELQVPPEMRAELHGYGLSDEDIKVASDDGGAWLQSQWFRRQQGSGT